jgi:integrase
MRRLLPVNVSSFKDRHGKSRYRFRKTGLPTYYFRAEPGSYEFLEELRACTQGAEPTRSVRIIPGTIHDLCVRYYRSQDFTGQSTGSQKRNRAIIESFRADHGDKRVATIGFEHLDVIFAQRAIKKPGPGGRGSGGAASAKNLRKQLRRLFQFAKKAKMRGDNPVEDTDRIRYKSIGFHTWTEEEIAQYQERHLLGTTARLALEIFLWTGQRRGDASTFGPGHVKGGCMKYKQSKTGRELWLPMAPQLLEAIGAMSSVGLKTFLVTAHGKPFTKAGLGNKMRDWCDEAGLPHCTAHGLRKAISRRMAERGAGNQGIKSVTGHTSDTEVSLYTAAVDQQRLANATLGDLAAWHLANRPSQLATSAGEPDEYIA